MYTNLHTKYGVVNFKIEAMPLKGHRRNCHGTRNKKPDFYDPTCFGFFFVEAVV